MGRITAINRQKRRADRVSVYIDGKYAVGCNADAVSAMGWSVGQELSEEDAANLCSPDGARRAFERALSLISYRSRSTGEIRTRLSKEGFGEEVVSGAIERLARLEMLNDVAFSDAWVRSRTANKPMGKSRLKWELRRRGVDREVAEQAVAQVDDLQEYELARRLAEPKISRLGIGIDARKKVAGYLQRRGFGWGIVSRVIGDLCSEE